MPDCSSLLPPARVIHEQVARNERVRPIEAQPETAATPEGIVSVVDALATLTKLLPALADALDRQSKSNPLAPRMALRLDEVAEAIGVSRRVLERERSAGRMPKPDLRIGKMPLWRPETIRQWIGEGADA